MMFETGFILQVTGCRFLNESSDGARIWPPILDLPENSCACNCCLVVIECVG
jgi:hypothetical protein